MVNPDIQQANASLESVQKAPSIVYKVNKKLSKKAAKTTTSEEHAITLKTLFLKEGLMLLFLALGLYLFLAISTYSPLDPGWSRTGDPNNIANAVGRSGAWISDVLLYSVTLPTCFRFSWLIALWPSFANAETSGSGHGSFFVLRGTGVILTLIGAATLASIHFSSELSNGAGGLLGNAISDIAIPSFDLAGTTLILLTMLFIGITLATGLSWLAVVDGAGRYCLLGYEYIGSACKVAGNAT